MTVLLLMQSMNQTILDVLVSAFPEGTEAILLTGSDLKLNSPSAVVKTSPHLPESLLSRMKCWIQYALDVRNWYKKHKNNEIDLIYAVSNPPINSFLGIWLKRKFHTKFIYMEWDIYPQVIESSLSNPAVEFFCGIWHKLNNRVLPRIDCLLTIGSYMRKSILKPVKKDINVRTIPMFTDINRMKPISQAENPFIQINELDGMFIVTYSGKMGLAHNIPIIMEAARILETQYPDIIFLMVGEGPGTKLVQKRIDAGSKNVKLFPLQPLEMFPYSLGAGDMGIVSEEEKLAKLFMPSKAYDMLACGLPLIGICSGEDDLYALISENQVGIAVTDSNVDTIVNAIVKGYQDRDWLKKTSECARKTAVDKYSKERITLQYKEVFDEFMVKGE